MVRSELITKIASKFKQLSDKDIKLGVEQILECIGDALSRGEQIEIRGFGSLKLQHRPSRQAYNPKTREKVITTPKCGVRFKAGKELHERINKARETVAIKLTK